MSTANKIFALIGSIGALIFAILFLLKGFQLIHLIGMIAFWEFSSSTILEEQLKQKGVI